MPLTRAVPGPSRRSCNSQKRLAGTAEPFRVARPSAGTGLGLELMKLSFMAAIISTRLKKLGDCED